MAYHYEPHHHIVLLRHAQSQFNLATIKYVQQNNVDFIWEELCKIQDFRKQVCYNHAYIDPPITLHGREQCKITRKKLSDHNFDLVIVSPHLRTLQTCQEVFGDRDIRIIVDPIFSEVFRYSCDVSSSNSLKKQQYSKYDWSEVDKWGQFWYVKVLPEAEREQCFEKLKLMQNEEYFQKQKMILKMMEQNKIYQHPQYIKNRSMMMKKQITKYGQKFNKIAVVSHYYSLTYLLAKQFNNEHKPQTWDLQNCYPYWSSAKELSTVDISYDQ